MKTVAIVVGAAAVAGLAFFAWRAHRTAAGAVALATQAGSGSSGASVWDNIGSAFKTSLLPVGATVGPATAARTGRGHF